MFNLPQKVRSGSTAQSPGMTASHPAAMTVSTIKKSFGIFSMLNLNDLVICFDDFGLDLREVHIPSLVIRMDKLFQNAPTASLLYCIRDLSTRVPFLTNYTVYLLEKGEYLRAQAVLKELTMLKIEQTTKFC
jgi:hypothetical protein